MKAKITVSMLRGLSADIKPYEVNDVELTGFLARVQPTGVISFYYSYRNTSGKRQRVKLGKLSAISVAQARAAASLAAGQVALGQDPVRARKDAKQMRASADASAARLRTLGEFLNGEYRLWCEGHRANPAADLSRLRTAFSPFLDTELDKIEPWELEKWRLQRKKLGSAPGTTNRLLGELKTALGRAVTSGFATVNGASKVKLDRVENSMTRHLSAEEEGRLRAALNARDQAAREKRMSANQWRDDRDLDQLPCIEDADYSDHLSPMVLLSLNTGMRQGEVFKLHWEHVDLNRKQVTITPENAKSKTLRHIPLNDEAASALSQWKTQTGGLPTRLVFPSRRNAPMDNVKNSWKRLLAVARISNFRWHDIRHTFASNLVMAGVDLNTVRELLGHADMKMTLRYAHLAPQHKADAVAKLLRTPPTH